MMPQRLLDDYGLEHIGPFAIHEGFIVHPMLLPQVIGARTFQLTIAMKALKRSVLVVIPTGLGKTVIAALVVAEMLQHDPESKIVFLAPTKPLADQHFQSFASMLKPVPSVLFTGGVAARKRQKLWSETRLVFSTPQTIKNDLEKERYALDDVMLIIVDEAHRAVGDYAYVSIMKYYDGQVLGLTASPGAKRERVQEVLDNLNIGTVEIRMRKDPDVAPYVQEIVVEWERVEVTPELLTIQGPLKSYLTGMVKKLQKIGLLRYKKAENVSKKDILSSRVTIAKRFKRNKGTMFGAIHNQTLAVFAYHAIELLETQGVHQCRDYLVRMVEKPNPTKAEKAFLKDKRIQRVIGLCTEYEGLSHPKLARVSEYVRAVVERGGTAIVFTQIRETIPLIIAALEGLSVRRFVGQAQAADGKGLKQSEQREILDMFRNREFEVLVATSVAEEGIDIPDVDLVVFYEPIPSEIRAIQRRGRTGRSSVGRVVVFITSDTRDEAYHWAEQSREKKMERLVRWMAKKDS